MRNYFIKYDLDYEGEDRFFIPFEFDGWIDMILDGESVPENAITFGGKSQADVYDTSHPIISYRFKEFLEKERVPNIEFVHFQAKAADEDDEFIEWTGTPPPIDTLDCYISKFTNIIQGAVNLNESDVKVIGGTIRKTNKLILNTEKLSHFCKMEEYPSRVIISEEMKLKIEKEGFIGFKFVDIETYSGIGL